MSVLVLLVLMFAMAGHSDATWCACKSDVSDSALQKALDYACGAGADCNPILQNGPCFQPNNVRAHCSYAVNSYFQKKGQVQGSCDFSGAATISPSDPSPSSTCVFPSTASSTGGTGMTPPGGTGMTPPGSSSTSPPTTPSTTNPTTTPPTGFTPNNGGLGGGGFGSGLGPSGTGSGINTDSSDAWFILQKTNLLLSLLLTLWLSCLVFLWG